MSVVISGAVLISVHGLLKHKRLPGEWAVLNDVGGKGDRLPSIQLYAEQNAARPVHIIVLEHLKFSDKSYLQQETHFNLSIKKEKHQFQFDSVSDKDDWVHSLCHVSPELWKQRSNSMRLSDMESSEGSEDMMQENFLYDSCGAVQQFKVSVCPTKASESNKLQDNYFLSPGKDALHLLDMVTMKSLHEWPYKQVRKYGRTRKVFRLEVGRKCSTGEGEFEFFTPDGSTLTDLVTMYMKQVRENRSSQEELGPGSIRTEPPPHSASDLSSAARSSPHMLKPSPRSKMDMSPSRGEGKERETQQSKGSKTKGGLSAAHHRFEGNIYDEPGDFPMSQRGASHAEQAQSNPTHRQPPNVYSLPEKPKKDRWKTHARPDSGNVHTEDYNSIKKACEAQRKLRIPLTSPQVSPAYDDKEDTYNHLGVFSRQASSPHPENVYGMASAKDTLAQTDVSAYRPPPLGCSYRPPPVSAFAGGNEYEDADDFLPQKFTAKTVRNEYEDTS